MATTSVTDAVDTFAGIANENEFYSHHYLAEVFKGDIKSRLEAWDAHEALHPGDESERVPAKRLSARGQKWFALRGQMANARDDAGKWHIFTQIQTGLLQALGYAAPGKTTPIVELVPGQPLPLWQLLAKGEINAPPQLAIVPAYQPGLESEDLLDHQLTHLHYAGQNVPPALKGQAWAAIVSEALFGFENPPRFCLLLGLDHWLLLDRYKWPNNRALRFDWVDILDRKDTATLQAASALLHHDSLAPGEGVSLLESLDENAHKHALREAIELLGNEAARQLRRQAVDAHDADENTQNHSSPCRPDAGYSLIGAHHRPRTEDPLSIWPHQNIYNKSASSPDGTSACSYEQHSISRTKKSHPSRCSPLPSFTMNPARRHAGTPARRARLPAPGHPQL